MHQNHWWLRLPQEPAGTVILLQYSTRPLAEADFCWVWGLHSQNLVTNLMLVGRNKTWGSAGLHKSEQNRVLKIRKFRINDLKVSGSIDSNLPTACSGMRQSCGRSKLSKVSGLSWLRHVREVWFLCFHAIKLNASFSDNAHSLNKIF